MPSITTLACSDPIVKNSYLSYHCILEKIYYTKSAPTIIIVQETFAVARLVLLFIRRKAITCWLPTRLCNSGTQKDSRCSELNENPKTFFSSLPLAFGKKFSLAHEPIRTERQQRSFLPNHTLIR